MNGKRACQTMLKALDSMRARRARALVTLDAGGGSRKAWGVKNRPKERLQRDGHAYWVNVDYLDAADAAITVGAPFTATLLVEAWLEHTRQTVKLDQHESVDKGFHQWCTASSSNIDEAPRMLERTRRYARSE